MKYLEYISAATGIAKAQTAIAHAFAHMHQTRHDFMGFSLVRKNNVPTLKRENICSVAADYDAMSKPCMEKLHVKRIQRIKYASAHWLETTGEDLVDQRLDALDIFLEEMLANQL